MAEKLRWGVLGAAKIARVKVIPGMTACQHAVVTGIASRDLARAKQAAESLSIPKAYGSYEELLADPDIDVVYNPLPNHLHVPWSIKAAEAGKHVLCEKPVGLNRSECLDLIAARDKTGVQIGEAFMVRSHPQWIRVREMVRSGMIGELRSIAGMYSYRNADPANVRSRPEWGGGGLLDIGCYLIQTARYLFESEPVRVAAAIQRDPDLGIDRLTSGVLEFASGHAIFTCGTQHVPYQRVHVFGTDGRIELEIPFNAPPDRSCRIFVDNGSDVFGGGVTVETFPVVDQYALQADLFSLAVQGNGQVPTPLEDSLANMSVIDQVFASASITK